MADDDLIFNNGGKVLRAIHYQKARDLMAVMLGENAGDFRERRIGFYELCRHAYRTAIINSGITDTAQKYYIGHSNKTDADEVYKHYDKLPLKEIADDGKKIIGRMEDTLDLFNNQKCYNDSMRRGKKAEDAKAVLFKRAVRGKTRRI